MRTDKLYPMRLHGYHFTPATWFPPEPLPNQFYIMDDFSFLVPGIPPDISDCMEIH